MADFVPADVVPSHLFSPEPLPLDESDLELIQAAHDQLRKLYRPLWHTVAAALRGVNGEIWTGIHLGATVGRLSICAEAVALGRALIEGDGSAVTAVAVRHPKPDEVVRDLAVVSPCGACRENLTDYDRNAMVIVSTPDGLRRVPVRTLLPLPYQR